MAICVASRSTTVACGWSSQTPLQRKAAPRRCDQTAKPSLRLASGHTRRTGNGLEVGVLVGDLEGDGAGIPVVIWGISALC